jgi:hypothetical protein
MTQAADAKLKAEGFIDNYHVSNLTGKENGIYGRSNSLRPQGPRTQIENRSEGLDGIFQKGKLTAKKVGRNYLVTDSQ